VSDRHEWVSNHERKSNPNPDHDTADLRPKYKTRITSLVHAYDVIKMCAPPAPPIRLRIRIRTLTLNPNPNSNPDPNPRTHRNPNLIFNRNRNEVFERKQNRTKTTPEYRST